MSSTLSPDSPAGIFSTDKIGGFGYGIAVSVGILLLITTITLASYYCTRNNTSLLGGVHQHRSHHHRRFTANTSVSASADIESGIDEVTLMSYPKLLYSDAKSSSVNAAAVSCCSICLADYKEKDEVRQLPECGHVFHVWCLDPWLRLRPTCPLCRTSPLPSPLPTPLQEVVPLELALEDPVFNVV